MDGELPAGLPPVTSFLFRVRNVTPSHVEVAVFAGPDAEHRALAGAFMLRHQEARDLEAGIHIAALDVLNRLSSDAYADGLIPAPAWSVEAQGFERVPS